MNASDIGRALGKLGLGRKKTMTPEAIEQRRSAAKISASKRRQCKTKNASVVTSGSQ